MNTTITMLYRLGNCMFLVILILGYSVWAGANKFVDASLVQGITASSSPDNTTIPQTIASDNVTAPSPDNVTTPQIIKSNRPATLKLETKNFNEDVIVGENQSINIHVSDTRAGKPVGDAHINGSVKYPSGHIVLLEEDTTDHGGDLSYTWKIAKDAKSLGLYHVYISAGAGGYRNDSMKLEFKVLPYEQSFAVDFSNIQFLRGPSYATTVKAILELGITNNSEEPVKLSRIQYILLADNKTVGNKTHNFVSDGSKPQVLIPPKGNFPYKSDFTFNSSLLDQDLFRQLVFNPWDASLTPWEVKGIVDLELATNLTRNFSDRAETVQVYMFKCSAKDGKCEPF